MEKPNISMFVLDTMRLDTWNGMRKESDLSKYGDFFEMKKFIIPATWTLPSHASLFTGMYSSEHKAQETREIKALDIDRIKLKKKTVISKLRSMGYHTYMITSNPYLHPLYGFDEFDVFKEETYFTDISGSTAEVAEKFKPLLSKYRNTYGPDVLRISAAMLREDPGIFFDVATASVMPSLSAVYKKLKARMIDNWPVEKGGKNMVRTLRGMQLKEPYFLFVNFMEPHDPYVGKPGQDFNWATPFMKKQMDESMIALWKRLYLKACRMSYGYAMQMLEDVTDRYGDEQILALTSDHGQSFGEHDGFVGHGTMLYDELVKEFFSVSMPQRFERILLDRYSSFVNVKDFLLSAIGGDERAVRKLYSKEVRAESGGVPANLYNIPGIDLKRLSAEDRPHVRIFKN